MKTFEDLEFGPHPIPDYYSQQALYKFDNGISISVITGKSAYSDEDDPYEVLIRQGNEMLQDGYHPIGWCNQEKVTTIMEILQSISIMHILERELKKRKIQS